MARKTVGLALGAGSARGFAHLGVLQVFEEHGIPVDYIAGSSMGAVVGGVYACGTDLSMLIRVIPQLDSREYMDFGLPRRGGVMRGERFRQLVRLFTKNYTFKDLHIPFECVAVDLLSGDVVTMREGSVEEALRGSYAIPVVFEPHPWNGKLLVDGGTRVRVPCETVREMGSEIVIGVDVGYRGGPPSLELRHTTDYLFASLDIMSWEMAKGKENTADLMIVPQVRHLDPNSFADAALCVELGREAAQQALPQIVQLLK